MPVDALVSADAPASSAALTSGFAQLDEATGGLRPGDCWVITGRPGQARTSLLLTLALRVTGGLGLRAWLSCPRTEESLLLARVVAAVGRVQARVAREWYRGNRTHIADVDAQRIARAEQRLRGRPLILHAASGQAVAAEALAEAARPEVVLLDDCALQRDHERSAIRQLTEAGVSVVTVAAREQVLSERFVCSQVADVADVVIEVVVDGPGFDLRPGEADLILHRNRFGHLPTEPVSWQGYYSRLVPWVR